jgi:hypothetical protein
MSELLKFYKVSLHSDFRISREIYGLDADLLSLGSSEASVNNLQHNQYYYTAYEPRWSTYKFLYYRQCKTYHSDLETEKCKGKVVPVL